MAARFRHLALNADDVERAKSFYAEVFGWSFQRAGPLGYHQFHNAGEGLVGALQGRREIKPGVRMAGVEATVAVDDIDATLKAVADRGGRIVHPAFHMDGVGRLAYIEDTEGNFVGVMQYDPGVFD
jgi:uncharacterized protein